MYTNLYSKQLSFKITTSLNNLSEKKKNRKMNFDNQIFGELFFAMGYNGGIHLALAFPYMLLIQL